MTRIPLATQLKTRSGDTSKDARLKNAYAEVRGEQSVVRHRPSARGGVSIGTGTAQGGIGFSLGGTDYLYTFNGDVGALNTISVGTTWDSGTTYPIGYHVSVGFVDYWATAINTNSMPPSSDWSTDFVPPVPVITYATWNPLDKYSSLVLSNGDLRYDDPADDSASLRATIGKSSGKWYWEVTTHAASCEVGVADSTASLSQQIGSNASGWGYLAFNTPGASVKRNNGVTAAYGQQSFVNDVIGVLLDMDSGQLSFQHNGVDLGVAYTGLTGTLYPMCSTVTTVGGTANFGASAFAYSVPSGYNSGLYTL